MESTFDFAQIMERVQKIIKRIEPHDSPERYTGLGVDCLTGKAKILSPWEIEIDGKVITAANITIATGASPALPAIPGIESAETLTSDTLWNLRTLPRRFLVLGAGPIGVEMAQAFCRLGSEVTVVQRGPRILPREDADVAEELAKQFSREGIQLLHRT